jgi:hypothetical protein
MIKSTGCGKGTLTIALAWVGVCDLALAQVIATKREEAGSERIIVSAGVTKSRMPPPQRLAVVFRGITS